MKQTSARTVAFVLVTAIAVCINSAVFAQDDLTYAVSKIVSDEQAVSGDIVSMDSNRQLIRTLTPFDPMMYGVIGNTATIIYYPTEEGVPIIRQGEVSVLVTTLTGTISPGDYITSSPIPGKGQKTTIRDGWVVGIALTELNEGEGETISFEGREITQGAIKVSLILGPALEGSSGEVSRIVDQLAMLLLKNVQTPTGTNSFFRFILAALIAIAAIAIGFGSFGKNVTRGIEAIGRNPLAKRQIQVMILLNVFLIALISLAGIVLALAIIRY